MTRVDWIRPQYAVGVGVILLHFLDSYAAHNIPDTDPNIADISLQTITISDYSDKIHVEYPIPDDYPQTDQASLDTWSVIWYIASFGGLILFFLIVSCSEWCCRRSARRNCQINNGTPTTPPVADTPPPSYDHFAPPAYEDLWVGSSRGRRGEKSEYDIYVVPVHALGTIMEEARRDDAPPSYQSASTGFANLSDLPQVHSPNGTSRVT